MSRRSPRFFPPRALFFPVGRVTVVRFSLSSAPWPVTSGSHSMVLAVRPRACAGGGDVIRAYVMQRVGYVFLVKNLFLAWIPYGLSLAALHLHRTPSQQSPRRWMTIAALWLAWLAMLPNAPYILTDLIHWRNRHEMAWWFDLGMMLSFA